MLEKRARKNNGQSLFSDQAYLRLRELIVGLKLAPEEPLSEARLSSVLGMSRTPVREALKRMKAEGYLISKERKGYFVNILTLKEFKDIYEVRIILEGAAAKLAANSIDLESLKSFGRQFEQYERAVEKNADRVPETMKGEFVKLGREFHSFIAEAAKNRKLRELITNIYDQLIITRALTFDIQRDVGEHLSIIKALEERNGEESLRCMEEHLRKAFDALTRVL